jgi:hypothetical protein
MVFMRMDIGSFTSKRWVDRVYSSNGSSGHVLIYDANQGIRPDPNSEVYLTDSGYVNACQVFLEEMFHSGVRTIEETRQQVVDFLSDK